MNKWAELRERPAPEEVSAIAGWHQCRATRSIRGHNLLTVPLRQVKPR